MGIIFGFSYKMKKGSKSNPKVIQDDPKENSSPNVTPTPTPTPQPSVSQSMVFGKKQKREYALSDVVHDEKIFTREVHARVITNENGTFIDVRKYFYGKPSQKGIRMNVEEFKSLCSWANDTLNEIEK